MIEDQTVDTINKINLQKLKNTSLSTQAGKTKK